jgi:FAD:protein FMN transferase
MPRRTPTRFVASIGAWLAIGFLGTGPAGADEKKARFMAEELHMGTQVRIVVYAADEATGTRAMRQAFDRIGELELVLSDYRSDSEAMRLCASAPHATPVAVSDDLWRMLRESVAWSERTGGAFDVSVGPLTRLWRRARRQKELPEPGLLAEARQSVGYLSIDVGERPHVRLLRANMRLDFGGIAKGFAAQEAIRVLAGAGCPQALVDAGGDIALGAAPPDATAWRIGVASVKGSEPPRYWLCLHDCVIATSGDLWQFLEIDGVRYSHVLDPQTGMGVTRRGSATIIAADGCAADALASASCVLAPDKAISLIEQHGASGLLLTAVGLDVSEHRSPQFARLLAQAQAGRDDEPCCAADRR